MSVTPFRWQCPTCSHFTTITAPDYANKCLDMICTNTPDDKGVELWATLIECPNSECRAQFFSVKVNRGARVPNSVGLKGMPAQLVGIGRFTFLPTTATPLSSYAPAGVAQDYNEAYLIRALSPKASATLARRALQGMVRDFWKVYDKKTLYAELESIKDQCNPDLYEAMMAVRSIGNVGAHPERDINLIQDVEPGEPEALLELIHLLDREWYVARAESQRRISKVKNLTPKPA